MNINSHKLASFKKKKDYYYLALTVQNNNRAVTARLTRTSSPSSSSPSSSRCSDIPLPVLDSTTSPWSRALTSGRCSRKTSTRATCSAATSSPGHRSRRSGNVTQRQHQQRAEDMARTTRVRKSSWNCDKHTNLTITCYPSFCILLLALLSVS